tara:strand:+ start:23 stop:1390 length:1368 start_codon:yes stop_codon:yes gene_type:complete
VIYNISEVFISLLEKSRQVIFPESPDKYSGIISDAVHTSLNLINKSDALYHDVEHTCMVTLCGQDILQGKKLLEGQLQASDWLHYTIALLFHDIGYVRNILNGDSENIQIIDGSNGDTIQLRDDATDASLTPYHVERGEVFLRQRAWNPEINVDLLCDLIRFTQFPIPKDRHSTFTGASSSEQLATLVGSADLIGQMADPHYDKKISALYYEFYETGVTRKLGLNNVGDLRETYPSFFINFVRPHISEALKYLNATEQGRQWVANLNYHVFSQENSAVLESSGIRLLQDISNSSQNLKNLKECLKEILGKVCEYQDWPLAHIFEVTKTKDSVAIVPTNIWHSATSLNSISQFREVTAKSKFSIGEGLPGRVVEDQKPAWIKNVTEDDNFPRAKNARDVGVKGAFAFPVFGATGVKYIIECFSLEAEEPDSAVLSLMQQVGFEINKLLGLEYDQIY